MAKLKKIGALALCLILLAVCCGCELPFAEPKQTESARQTVSVTLPEGYTLVKMAWAFEKAGVFSSEDFINAAANFDFSQYDFLSQSVNDVNVCFKLEGYLAPNTYEFYVDETPENAIKKLLDQRKGELTQAVRDRAKELGMSVHEVITLASLIEKECYQPEEKVKVSSVFHNRLNAQPGGVNPTKLQSNTTDGYADYVIAEVYPDLAEYYHKYYDTYERDGLPAGPICNPSLSSIMAALYPETTDYYYFAITQDGARYAADYDTHRANCKALGLKNY